MSTFVIAYLAASAVFALVLVAGRRIDSGVPRGASDVTACNERLSEIDKKVRSGDFSEDEAGAARLEIISGLLDNGANGGGALLPFRRATLAAATVLSMATSVLVGHFANTFPFAAAGAERTDVQLSGAAAEDEVIARLREYANPAPSSLPASLTGPMSRPGEPTESNLPDVNTMIERLAGRLEKEPGDAAGWHMLGWSYTHTERFDEAEKAYARALALNPDREEYKADLAGAKAKLAAKSAAVASMQAPESAVPVTGANASSTPAVSPGPSPADIASAEAMPAGERDTMVRSMVDRLAGKLATSPHDADGWKRLIRSRTVLGEKEAAAAALRKALEIFKNEPDQMTEIAALANELGVTSE